MALTTYETIESALFSLSPDVSREEWVRIGMALKHGLNGGGFELFDQWSRQGKTYHPRDCRDTWESIQADGKITVGTLLHLAKQHGWSHLHAFCQTKTHQAKKPSPSPKKAATEPQKELQKRHVNESFILELLDQAHPANPKHPYFQEKGISHPELYQTDAFTLTDYLHYRPHSKGQFLTGEILLIPIQINEELTSLEFIDEKGRKCALAGGKKSGGFWKAQPLPNEDEDVTLLIGEGVATVLSAAQATGYPVIATLSAGNFEKVTKHFRELYPHATLLILGDCGNGREYAEQAAKENNALVVFPSFRKEGKGNDFNDLYIQEGTEEVLRQIKKALEKQEPKTEEVQMTENWKDRFFSRNDRIVANVHNVDLILTHDPEWKGVIAYNEFVGKILKVKTPPFGRRSRLGEWEDRDNVMTANWITDRHKFSCSPSLVAEAILSTSEHQRFNPARDSIEKLQKQWDKKQRLDHWLEQYCHVEVHDNNKQYIKAISRAYLIGLVARILEPGCKRDEMLIMQGAQGTMKSTAAKILADAILPDSFTDEIPALHGKDAGTQLRGIIIAELSELDQFQRNEMETVKAFISRRVDRYREPYSRYALDHPRTVSFFGTSNKPLIFKDSSGGRRFWVCEVRRKIDIKALERDAAQLIGEAANAYKRGEPWHLTNEQAIQEALEEQEARFDVDPWEEAIACFCLEKERVTIQEITERVIDMPLKDVGQREKNRISQILQRLGFKFYVTTDKDRKRIKVYRKV